MELGGIALHRIHNMALVEQADFVHHRIPGLDGNVPQNLGRQSVQLRVDGICYGATAREDLERMRGLYLKREPVDFIADLVGQSYIGQVVIDRLDVREVAHEPEQYSYRLLLCEYVEPPQPSQTGPSLDIVNQQIGSDAQALFDIATLPDALSLGSLPELSNPFEPLKGALDQVQGAAGGLQQATEGLRRLFGG